MASEEGAQAESPQDQVVTSVSLAYQWTLSILLAQCKDAYYTLGLVGYFNFCAGLLSQPL